MVDYNSWYTRFSCCNVEEMSSAAKTVSFSPLRRGQISLKNTLDTPLKLKWPDISPKLASQILLALEKSLSEMKGCFARRQLPKRKRKRRSKNRKTPAVKSGCEPLEPPRKKQCIQPQEKTPPELLLNIEAEESSTLSNKHIDEQSISSKKSQLVIGVNHVTRCLERGELCAGCVCLSAKPSLVTRHIMMLAATRSVPFVALPHLGQKVVESLGDIKSALAIGFKKSATSEFNGLTETISKLAPPIVLPWLSAINNTESHTEPKTTTTEAQDKTTTLPNSDLNKHEISTPVTTTGVEAIKSGPGPCSLYTPVKIKKTLIRPKKSKGKK